MKGSELLTGSTGVAAVEVMNHVNLETVSESGGIIIQIIIGILTVLKMWKKKKQTIE